MGLISITRRRNLFTVHDGKKRSAPEIKEVPLNKGGKMGTEHTCSTPCKQHTNPHFSMPSLHWLFNHRYKEEKKNT